MAELFKRILEASTDCQRKSKVDFSDLIEANHSTCKVIFESVDRYSLKGGKTNTSISNRLLLASNFIQGIYLSETAIIGGFYSQGGALVRQELETLAAIAEHKKGKWKPGKTPNVKNMLGVLADAYPGLSNLTHLGNPTVLDPLHRSLSKKTLPDIQPCSMVPVYNIAYAKSLYSLHTFFIVDFSFKNGELLLDLYGEALTPCECQILIKVQQVLQGLEF